MEIQYVCNTEDIKIILKTHFQRVCSFPGMTVKPVNLSISLAGDREISDGLKGIVTLTDED